MASQEMENLKSSMKLMMAKGFAPRFDGSLDPFQLRAVIEAAQIHAPLPEGIAFEELQFNGITAEFTIMQNAREDAVILYIHGGGFICGNTHTSRTYAAMLANESRIPVYTLSYRLAPENPYPAAVNDCFAAYKGFIENNTDKSVFLIGESAGATLCLITVMKARDENIRIPDGVVLYSPLIDFSGVSERNTEKDFTITQQAIDYTKQLYCGSQDQKDPYLSPLYADFKNICPVYLAWDESESLSADAEILYQKASAAGTCIKARSFPDCFHAFAIAGKGTPESSAVLAETIEFFNSIKKAGE